MIIEFLEVSRKMLCTNMFKAGTSTYFILNTPIKKYFSLHLNRLFIVLNKFLVKIIANKFYISAINRFKVHVIFWRQNEKTTWILCCFSHI